MELQTRPETALVPSNDGDRPAYGESQVPGHVAFLVAEMAPLVKVGGLADVAGSLPAALARRGTRVTVVLPAYGTIDYSKWAIRRIGEGLFVPLGGGGVGYALLESDASPPGVRWLLVEHNDFFRRDGIYIDPATKSEYPDNALRYGFFTRAALDSLRVLRDRVNVIHTHDFHTGLAPAMLDFFYRDDPVLGRARTVHTIHNLGFQGIYPPEILDALNFGAWRCHYGSPFEYYGNVNFMKAAIHYADAVSTVSETYAREICEDEIQSAGLGVPLQARADDLFGIVNGIDVGEWNPETDPHLAERYSADHLEGKRGSKRALLSEFGLDSGNLDAPLFGMVTRLMDQKGLDLVTEAFGAMMDRGLRLVVLGSGLPKYEKFLTDAVDRYPGRLGVRIAFDNGLAHRIEAGADLFLMPSLYEPCGLNQLYSLRYGTVPVVRATGGLADTVPDADENTDGVGFAFREYTAAALLDCLDRALRAFRDPARFRAIQRRGMSRDLSWEASASRYLRLYAHALAKAPVARA